MYRNPFHDKRHELNVDRLTGSRFLGKSLFWRHLGKMHTKHVYRSDSVEYRSLKLMITETVLVILVATFFSLAVSYRYNDAVDLTIVSQNEFWGAEVGGITNISHGLDWISDQLVPRVFSSSETFSESQSGLTPPPNWLVMGQANSSGFVTSHGIFSLLDFPTWSPNTVGGSPFEGTVLVGPPRIRQVATQTKLIPSNGSDSIKDAFVYIPSNVTQQPSSVSARGTVLEGGGYIFDLKRSRNETLAGLAELRSSSWIDSSTTALVIELSVLNSRTGVVSNTIVILEVIDHDTGSVASEVHSFPTKIPPSGLPISYVLLIVSFAAFIAFTLYLLDLIMIAGPRDFFTYAWNLIDFTIVIIYFVYIGKLLTISEEIPSVLGPALSPLQSAFRPFSHYMDSQTELRRLEAVIGLLVWTRMIKGLALIGPFRTAIKVLERTVWTMTWYVLPVLVAVSIGFGYGLTVLLPDDFRTFSDGFYGIFFIFAHGIDLLPQALEKPEISGPILAVYVLLMCVLLPSICVAVALRCYIQYMEELKEADEQHMHDKLAVAPPGVDMNRWWHKDVVSAFIFTWLWRIKGIELYKEPDEDIGFPEEQDIDLALLPEIVQKRWIERKAELIEIVENRPKTLRLTAALSSKFGERISRLMSSLSKAQSKFFARFTMSANTRQINIIEGSDPAGANNKISRIQLQRLLDLDKDLASLLKEDCGHKNGLVRAIDVIRKFKTPAAASKVMVLTALLGSAGVRSDGSADSVRKGLREVLNEFEASWKEQFTSVMEAVTSVIEELAELTELIDERENASRRSSVSNLSFIKR